MRINTGSKSVLEAKTHVKRVRALVQQCELPFVQQAYQDSITCCLLCRLVVCPLLRDHLTCSSNKGLLYNGLAHLLH